MAFRHPSVAFSGALLPVIPLPVRFILGMIIIGIMLEKNLVSTQGGTGSRSDSSERRAKFNNFASSGFPHKLGSLSLLFSFSFSLPFPPSPLYLFSLSFFISSLYSSSSLHSFSYAYPLARTFQLSKSKTGLDPICSYIPCNFINTMISSKDISFCRTPRE